MGGAFRKWKDGGPSTKLSHDFGEHPFPLCKGLGSYTDSKFSLSRYPTNCKVPFFKVPHAYGAILQDTGSIQVAILSKLAKI